MRQGNVKKAFLTLAAAAVLLSSVSAGAWMAFAETAQEAESGVGSDGVTADSSGIAEGEGEIAESESGEKGGSSGEAASDSGAAETPARQSLRLLAAGDNLVHTSMLAQARQADGSYDFHPVYQYVKDFIQSYDLAVINQETIFVDNPAYASSYPEFGTPQSMGEALVDAGFDVILSATNHTMDKGSYGADCMLRYWKTYHPDITLLGLNQTAEEYNAIDYVEKNGIRLAMFNYTYGLNGHGLPADRPYLVNLLQNQAKFLQDVRIAEQTADLTVCFLHIGEEYSHTPTAYQQNYVRTLIDNGADIIICAHPHVVEPYGMVVTASGNAGLVYYSLGNFICNQAAMDRALGGLASVEIVKDGQGCRVESYDFIPTVAHFNQYENRVYLLQDYTDEVAAQHIMGSSGFYPQAIWNCWKTILAGG